MISPDRQDLLSRLDGKVIKFDGVSRTLLTKGVKPKSVQMSWRYRLLDTISNPTIAYILLMLGIYGIFFELSNPGAILPGVVGGIFLILAFYALQMLPINFAGLALILFAVILFIAEVKVVSHGLLAVGGVISLLLGSLMLIETPTEYMRISLSVIIPAVLVSATFFTFAVTKAVKARLTKPTTGTESALEAAGHPIIHIELQDHYDVGGQFLLWEIATAIVGNILQINPFDQPNVETAKVRARAMVSAYKATVLCLLKRPPWRQINLPCSASYRQVHSVKHLALSWRKPMPAITFQSRHICNL